MSDEKFWLKNLGALFSSMRIVPTNQMTLEQQFNALTRIVLVLTLIMYLLGYKQTLIFVIGALSLLIMMYYMQKNTIKKCRQQNEEPNEEDYIEQFSIPQNKKLNIIKPMQQIGFNTYKYSKNANPTNDLKPTWIQNNTNNSGLQECPIDQKICMTYDYARLPKIFQKNNVCPMFCNDKVAFNFNNPNEYYSPSHNLEKGQNPKTKIPPIIVPPSHDLSYWRDSDLVVHSSINEIPQVDNYLSGYAIASCDENDRKKYSRENFAAPKPYDMNPNIPLLRNGNVGEIRANQLDNRENFAAPKPYDMNPYIPSLKNGSLPQVEGIRADTIENYETIDNIGDNLPYRNLQSIYDTPPVRPNHGGWVNTTCGYNPSQQNVNLPNNLILGNCPQQPQFSQYNKNLFTQTIQPNMYSVNQVNEPINSNIGISFEQQFEPLTVSANRNGITYTQHDPRTVPPPPIKEKDNMNNPNQYNMYDPRFSGYGSSYRSYTDPTTGQTRYAYDDVNAINMPNYIVRSETDFLPFMDSFGPLRDGREFGVGLDQVKSKVNDAWDNNSLQFRGELMERLMRKRNAEMWQTRMYPLAGQKR